MLILPEPPWRREREPSEYSTVAIMRRVLGALDNPQLVHGLCTAPFGCNQGARPRALWTLTIKSDGTRIATLRAVPCDHKIKDRGAGRTEELPLWVDHRFGAACARCGSLEGTQTHHWAPRALFDDADEWPMAELCKRCHARWHRTMDQAARRRGAA